VLRRLGELHDTLRMEAYESFVEATRDRLAEICRIYSWNTAEAGAAPIAQLSKRAQLPWALAPLVPDEIDCRAAAGDRLIHCLTRTRADALRFVNAETQAVFSLPVMVGRIDGRWEVVR